MKNEIMRDVDLGRVGENSPMHAQRISLAREKVRLGLVVPQGVEVAALLAKLPHLCCGQGLHGD